MKVNLSVFFLLILASTFGQNQPSGWVTKSFSDLGFTENLGRYENVMGEEVQYFAEYGSYKIFFSNDAFVFGRQEELTKDEAYERHEKEEHGEEVAPIEWNYFKVEFSGANIETKIQAQELKKHTRNFQNKGNRIETIKASAFHFLKYENLYENIDMILELPDEGGLKYSFFVHPGADCHDIKMTYHGISVEKNGEGLLLNNEHSNFTDTKPIAEVANQVVASEFLIEGSSVGFKVDAYDLSQELIIDPWLVTDLPASGIGVEVSADNFGNCAVVVGPTDWQEVLYYDNTGTLIWTWGSLIFADITMDPISGNTYVVAYPGEIVSLDPTGVFIAGNPMNLVGYPEVWRVKYSEYDNQVVAGEGGLAGADVNISLLDPGLASYDPYISLTDETSTMEDCALLEIDPEDGSFYYVASAYPSGENFLYGNHLYKLNALDPSITIWSSFTNHTFSELENCSFGTNLNGVNGITCGSDYVYTYDGDKILQFDKFTGDRVDSLFLGTTLFGQYGIDMDNCGTLYVGTDDSILTFTQDLDPIGGFPIPGSCCDLVVRNNFLYASGISFAGQFDIEIGDVSLSSTSTACMNCSGTATILTEFCDVFDIVSIEWSPSGAMGETAEDLCPGWHIATTTLLDPSGNEFVRIDSVEIIDSISLDLDVLSFNNPSCYGFEDGSITVETAGGFDDVEFEWIPENDIGGATFNNLGAGTYTVIGNSDGCTDTLEISLTDPDSIYADFTIFNVPCFGDSTGSLRVDSVYNAQGDLNNISFYWAPNYFGLEGVGIDSAWGMPIGNYTLTINDDNGCSKIYDFSLTEPEPLIFSELGYEPAFCRLTSFQNGNGVVYAAGTGGVSDYSYNWEYLDGPESSITSTWGGRNPGTYRITVTDENGCKLIETIELDSVNPIAAFTVNSEQLNEQCEGTEVVLANFVNQSEFFVNPNDPAGDTTFFWNLDYPTEDWQISHSYFEEFDTSYVGEAIYKVCLVAINKNGCKDTTCKDLIVHVQPEFIAPNVFSPGGDGLNDQFTFEFRTLGIETFYCQIINRWGVVVAELNDITQGWDGTDFSGDLCNDGTYFYSYAALATNGTAFNGQGTVQLIRD